MKSLRIFLANVGLRTRLYSLVTPPVGLLYLAAYLRERFSVELKVVNQRIEGCSYEEIGKMAVDYGADIVGLSSMTPTAHGVPMITQTIRAMKPETFIVLGGPHVSSFGADALSPTMADVAVSGEGEISMAMIVEAFLGDKNYEHIPGLIRRAEEKAIVTNPGGAPMVQDLDTLPMPAYDLIDLSRYWGAQSMPPIPRRKYISLVSSRGCPYGCLWCHNIFGRAYRAHSPERVVDEIVYFKEKYGIKDVEFIDDCFNLQPARVTEFVDNLLARNGPIRIAFPNGVRSDILEETAVEALSRAGTYFCSFALESGSPRIQKLMQKRLDIDRFLDAVGWATKNRIFTNGFMMLGFPSETAEEMEQTIRIASESKLHTASFYTVTPFPGTPMFDYVKTHCPERIAHIDYSEMDFCGMRVNLSQVTDEQLYYYQRKAMRDFFLRPSRVYRIIRDFPQPHRLPVYIPVFISRAIKGLSS